MPYYCTVPQCTSMSGKIKNVSFHQFPRDEELADLWNKILKRGKPYTKYSKVCSLHFKPEDFKGVWKTLKKDAVPSRNLPTITPPRKSLNSVSSSTVETQIQQQLVQAIYSQGMIAMQAACLMANSSRCDESTPSSEDADSKNNVSKETEHVLPNATQLNDGNIELLRSILTNGHNKIENIIQTNRTYTCKECLKHYKDYDVFLLHKRTHKDDKEKENICSNQEILRANPILANLLSLTQENNALKTENDLDNSLVANIAANMKNYLHNLATLMIQDNNDCNDERKYEEVNKEDIDTEEETCDSADLE